MRHFGILVLCLSLSVGFISCKSSKKSEQKTAEINSNPQLQIVEPAAEIDDISAEFTITNVKVVDDELLVAVSHAGGCGTADYTLYWNSISKKSMPPQISLQLVLKKDDACESIVNKELSFDISGLKNTAPKYIVSLKGFEGRFSYPAEKP